MFIKITPVPKPRMVHSDRWKKRPAVERYYAFCDELRLKYPAPLPNEVRLIFYLAMPPSWSKQKKAYFRGAPHQQRPDIDNLTKAVMDALCPEDARIYNLHATKWWAEKPGIEIYLLK